MTTEYTFPSCHELPQPYRSEGGFDAPGIIHFLMIGFATTVVSGIIQGFFCSKGFNFIGLSPICLGFGLGFVFSKRVQKDKIRNRLLCAGVSALLGLTLVVCIHFFQYWLFERSLHQVPQGARFVARNFEQFRANRGEQPPQVQQLLDDFEKNPPVRESLAVSGFYSYLDLMAHRGMRVTDSRDRNRETSNFGYLGTYIYWGIEALLIIGIACACAISTASEPFCTECHCWKTPQAAGYLLRNPILAKQALASGDLSFFDSSRPLQPKSAVLQADLLVCPECQSPDRVEVRLNYVVFKSDRKGHSTAQKGRALGTFSYPAEAAQTIVNLIHSPFPQQVVDATNKSNDLQTGSSYKVFGYLVLGFAAILFVGTTFVSIVSHSFSPVGFSISGVLTLCGLGLMWVGSRHNKRVLSR